MAFANSSALEKPTGNLQEQMEGKWSGRPDLNRGPHAPQACALPGCATPRPHLLSNSRLSLAFQQRQETAQAITQIQQHFAA